MPRRWSTSPVLLGRGIGPGTFVIVVHRSAPALIIDLSLRAEGGIRTAPSAAPAGMCNAEAPIQGARV
jgi:hypothetical protein